jgi:hypothetical protein
MLEILKLWENCCLIILSIHIQEVPVRTPANLYPHYSWPPCRAGMTRGTVLRRVAACRHADCVVPNRVMGQAFGPWHSTWAVYPCRATHGSWLFSLCHVVLAYGTSTLKHFTRIRMGQILWKWLTDYQKEVGEGLREKEWPARCRGHQSKAGELKATGGGGSDWTRVREVERERESGGLRLRGGGKWFRVRDGTAGSFIWRMGGQCGLSQQPEELFGPHGAGLVAVPATVPPVPCHGPSWWPMHCTGVVLCQSLDTNNERERKGSSN